jgi:hypothetical protein
MAFIARLRSTCCSWNRLARVIKAAMIAALLGGGWFASHTTEFHVPASIVEALLPRLQAAF